jgi:hypothetical protein
MTGRSNGGERYRSFLRHCALVVAFSLTSTSTLQAAFLDLDVGARPVGMGGAFTAISDDSSAALYNPAGIVQVQWNELTATYADLFSGLDVYAGEDTTNLTQSFFAFTSRPIPKIGSFELSWASFNSSHLYREDTVALTYARNLGDFFPVLDNTLALGVNLKYLRRSVSLDSFTIDDPVFAGGDSADGQTVDLGVLYHPSEGMLAGWRLGASVLNLTSPDVGFQVEDRVPTEGRLGIAYQSKDRPWLVPALDITRRGRETGIFGGMESWLFKNTLGLRGGANKDEGSAGLSYFQMLGKRFGIRIDYAFTIPFYVEESGGSHRMALTLYF